MGPRIRQKILTSSPTAQPHYTHRSLVTVVYTARTPVSAFAIPHVSALSRLVSSSSLKHINKEHRPLVAPPRLRVEPSSISEARELMHALIARRSPFAMFCMSHAVPVPAASAVWAGRIIIVAG